MLLILKLDSGILARVENISANTGALLNAQTIEYTQSGNGRFLAYIPS
jgi:hypothetical protein